MIKIINSKKIIAKNREIIALRKENQKLKAQNVKLIDEKETLNKIKSIIYDNDYNNTKVRIDKIKDTINTKFN